MSSVSPLNARPSAASRLPRSVHSARQHLVEEDFLLRLVDLANFMEQLEVDAALLRHPVKCGHVFGKAGAAVAQPGAQKLGPDAAVQAHARGDVLDVRVHGFGQIGHRIDERNLQRQESIRGVLDDLRALRRGDQQLGRALCSCRLPAARRLRIVAAPGQRLVDAPQHFGGALVVRAHHDAVRMQKIDDGRAFAQKLGIRDHIEALRVHAMAVQHAPNPLVGVNRHRALFHDHLVTVDGAGNL